MSQEAHGRTDDWDARWKCVHFASYEWWAIAVLEPLDDIEAMLRRASDA